MSDKIDQMKVAVPCLSNMPQLEVHLVGTIAQFKTGKKIIS
jgi:hypothetical protein